MTGTPGSARAAVDWLTAQSVVFGVMAALLGIVANAMFLDAYGSAWLPVTYIVIGVAGIVVSGAVARAAQPFDLIGIALAVLGGAAIALGAAWLVALGGDGAWVSAPLLVLFPILIQLGFVFIGRQAGRILDIAGIKASFPRIMAGFPIGAVLGGLLGGAARGVARPDRGPAAGDGARPGRVRRARLGDGPPVSGELGAKPARRRPCRPVATTTGHPTPPFGGSLRSRFVVLLLAYQVLSALGSQLSDFLVFDRASAQYPDPADLAAFLGLYTAVMNSVSIAFLFILAGPLLRRSACAWGSPPTRRAHRVCGSR